MPLLGYLLYVGGTLLALLFVADIYVPRQPAREEAPRNYHIPIAAAATMNAPIVFSGETRDFGRPPAMTVVDAANPSQEPARAAAQPAQTQDQEQVKVATRHEVKPARRKIARRRIAPPENSYAQVPDEWRSRYRYTGMAFARPPFGW